MFLNELSNYVLEHRNIVVVREYDTYEVLSGMRLGKLTFFSFFLNVFTSYKKSIFYNFFLNFELFKLDIKEENLKVG